MHQSPQQPSRPDRLSDLSDDILTHILSFAPTKEAASTMALSRRWRRPLWLDTAVVNLDSRSCTSGIHKYNKLHFPHPDGRVIKKVGIVVRDQDIPDDAMVSAVVAGVEELRLECQGVVCPSMSPYVYDTNVLLDTLPLQTLRVLDLTGCKLSNWWREMYQPSYNCWDHNHNQPPDVSWPSDWDLEEYYKPPSSFSDDSSGSEQHQWRPPYRPVIERCAYIHFPWLEMLRLQRCATRLDTLQAMIDAAAHTLVDLRLESITILEQCGEDPPWQVALDCQWVETLVLANFQTYDGKSISGCHIELHATHLRRLRYTQSMSGYTSLSFKSPAPHLQRVHLTTHSPGLKLCSSLLAALSHIKFLKLTGYAIDDNDFLVFPNLEHLEIEEGPVKGCLLP